MSTATAKSSSNTKKSTTTVRRTAVVAQEPAPVAQPAPIQVAAPAAPAPVAQAVISPAPTPAAEVAAPVKASRKRKTKDTPAVETAASAPSASSAVQEVVQVAASEVTAVEPASTQADAQKGGRQRQKLRSYSDLRGQISDDLETAYKSLQSAWRAFSSLESAHNREVAQNKVRESTHRTPTIVFDQQLVSYYLSRLSPEDLQVSHKEGDSKVDVDLSKLTTETRVHRTDVTQLYNKVFKKYNMQDPADGRNILYSGDKELVALLTSGSYNPSLESDVQAIKAGTFKLTIFNIQRFTNQHLSKVTLPKVEASEE